MATNFDIPKTPRQAADFSKLIIRDFGLQALKTELYRPGMPAEIEKDKELYKSKLGTPVFSNLEIKGREYTFKGQTYSFDDLQFDTVLFSIVQQKNIIATSVQGRNGTVKQYISDKDYLVTIQGILTSDNGVFPKDQLTQLYQVLKAPIAIEINSWYLSIFEIYNLVIDNYNIPQVEGGYSNQPFTLNCVSDLPVELKIR